MRKSADSWLKSATYAATLGLSFFGAEAASEEPLKQPEVPAVTRPETKSYAEQTEEMRKVTLARVIDLLTPTRSENDGERMKALNILEKELIPLGDTKLLVDTRRKIIEEPKIDGLAKKLAEQKGNE